MTRLNSISLLTHRYIPTTHTETHTYMQVTSRIFKKKIKYLILNQCSFFVYLKICSEIWCINCYQIVGEVFVFQVQLEVREIFTIRKHLALNALMSYGAHSCVGLSKQGEISSLLLWSFNYFTASWLEIKTESSITSILFLA